MRIKFITLTCEKYHNTRVNKIRETCGKNQDISFLSDFNSGDDIIGYDYLTKGYENIHYRKPCMDKNFKFVEDRTILDKMIEIRKKYELKSV